MRKKILVATLLILLLTGCCNINSLNYESIIEESMKEKNKPNVAVRGYNIFLPRGMSIADSSEDNIKITSNKDTYYLYIDTVGYYNKEENKQGIEADNIYKKIINVDGKTLQVSISKYKTRYFLEVSYNYGKIEVITSNVKEALSKSIIILKNTEFNDVILESLIGKSSFDYNETEFNLEKPSSDNKEVLQFDENYGIYEDILNELPDEDKIKVEKAE